MIPKVGPWDGWRKQAITFFFNWTAIAWHKPTVVVLFPSPRGVGVMLWKMKYILQLNIKINHHKIFNRKKE